MSKMAPPPPAPPYALVKCGAHTKNGYVPEKNFNGKKFSKSIFSFLKHVLDDSKSIPTKKIFEKFSKKFFGLNRFRMVQNVFKNENVDFENFFPLKIFFRDIAVFSKYWWPKNRKFFEKIFLVGIDLEWFKTYFKTTISILKIFSHWKFFSET